MKCVSVRQPNAWLLVNGRKDVLFARGKVEAGTRVLIHAGSHRPTTHELLGVWAQMETRRIREGWRPAPPCARDAVYGAIVGSVVVMECAPAASADEWYWRVEGAVAFATPVVRAGELGVFEVDEEETAGII